MAADLYFKFVLGLLLPTLAAGLAVMSVDYGGEYLKIAVVKPGVPMEIVLNRESQRKTPNIVALRDGERLFGDAALSSSLRYPKSAYRYLQDVLGKDFDNPLVAEFRQKYPYYEMEKDPETGAVLFVHDKDTKYSPEELIAMILQRAKESAEAFAEQPITEVVITIPAFFSQAERRAMTRAAELAGLKVLQLIGDNAAVALNYGIFRRKSFNNTPSYFMFFDIGATATVTTIVEYQVVKTKSSSGLSDTYPQLTIKGVGFDRTLGGSEFQRRLRDHLARKFNENRKIKKDVFNDPKALQKLYKEAGRVKQVLSANADHFAQVENLSDDEDFRLKVTREEFENLCEDLFEGIGKTVQDALEVSHLTMDEINEVILMGGGTRVPKIQETLKKAIGRDDLGKGINTDEAAALGAVYQAAHLGKGFKVQKFNVKEAIIYPIQVEFERVRSVGDSEEASKMVVKTLFGRHQSYPHKKVMTFNKNTKDFVFKVNYGDLNFLNHKELEYLGYLSLSMVNLSGVEEVFEKHGEGEVSKGIKAHFNVDESGLFHVDKVEATFEKVTLVEEEEESTLAKLGKSFSSFFGGQPSDDGKEGFVESEEAVKKNESVNEDKNVKDEGTLNSKEDKQTPPETEKQEESEQTKQEDPPKTGEYEETAGEKPSEEKTPPPPPPSSEEDAKDKADKKEEPSSEDAGKNEEAKKEKPKVEKKSQLVVLKENLKVEVELKDLKDPSHEKMKIAKKHLEELKKIDDEKDQLEKAKNDIESFVFDTKDKLEQIDYVKCSTNEERATINQALNAASDWMFEQEDNAPKKVFTDKMDELRVLTRDLFERVIELQQRPLFIDTLNSRVNHSEYFLSGMSNFTGEDQPFTQVEYDTLKNLIKEVKTWNKTVHMEQRKQPLTKPPRFTIEDIMTKVNSLDREIKYLVNKIKSYKPKSTKDNATSDSNAGAGADDDTLEKDNATNKGDKKSSKKDVPPVGSDDDDDVHVDDNQESTEDGTKQQETHDNGEL